MKLIRVLSFVFVLTIFNSCSSEDLFVEDLEKLEGSYTWKYNVCSEFLLVKYVYHTRDAATDDFTASVKFSKPDQISFYINDQEYLQHKFKVTSKEKVDDAIYIEIKVDVPKKKLDIDDKLKLVLRSDTLTIDKFPHDGYSKDSWGTNYFLKD